MTGFFEEEYIYIQYMRNMAGERDFITSGNKINTADTIQYIQIY